MYSINQSYNNKSILKKLLQPRTPYGFCEASVTYLIEYAFTFTLHHRNSPPSAYIRIQPIAVRERQATDRWTDTVPHFIMIPPYGRWGIIIL